MLLAPRHLPRLAATIGLFTRYGLRDFAKRQGWGWHDLDQWQLFFTTIKQIGQITREITPQEVLSNDYVAAANDFDHAKVKADAEGYELPGEFESVDVEAIRARI